MSEPMFKRRVCTCIDNITATAHILVVPHPTMSYVKQLLAIAVTAVGGKSKKM